MGCSLSKKEPMYDPSMDATIRYDVDCNFVCDLSLNELDGINSITSVSFSETSEEVSYSVPT